MSSDLASQTGLPWSRDSASANSSSCASSKSATRSSSAERCSTGVSDHLLTPHQHPSTFVYRLNFQSLRVMSSDNVFIVYTKLLVFFCLHICVCMPGPALNNWRLHHLSRASLMTQMGRNAAAGLPSSWRRSTAAALDWCLAWFWAKCHQCVKVWNFEHLIYRSSI